MEVIHIIDDYSIIQEDLKYFKITKEQFQLVLNKLIEIEEQVKNLQIQGDCSRFVFRFAEKWKAVVEFDIDLKVFDTIYRKYIQQ
jgi:hypothetical protein